MNISEHLSTCLELLEDKSLYYNWRMGPKTKYGTLTQIIAIYCKISSRKDLLMISKYFHIRPEELEKSVNVDSIGCFPLYYTLVNTPNEADDTELDLLMIFKKLHPPLVFKRDSNHRDAVVLRSLGLAGCKKKKSACNIRFI